MSGTIQASVVKDSASATNNLTLDTSGNVTVGNNLTVTGTTTHTGTVGATTFSGAVTCQSTLAVTGTITGSSTVADATAILRPLVSGTAQASTSGTSITFSSIPSWVKRITVMFNGVSTNGTSLIGVQLGAGSVVTTSYLGSCGNINNANGTGITAYSTLFAINNVVSAAASYYAVATIVNMGSNLWAFSSNCTPNSNSYQAAFGAGSLQLSGTLDRVVITTVNGTDTFDAGSINILYE